jgi:hypothetical protein
MNHPEGENPLLPGKSPSVPKYFRPTEVEALKADSSKAKKILNWTPRITFEDLIKIMSDADLEAIGLSSPGEGKKIINEKGLAWSEKLSGLKAGVSCW